MANLSKEVLDLHYKLTEIENAAGHGGVERAIGQIDDLLKHHEEDPNRTLLHWVRARIIGQHRGLLAGIHDYNRALDLAGEEIALAIRYELGVSWKEAGELGEAESVLSRTATDATSLRNWGVVARAKEHLSSMLEDLGRIDDARRFALEADEAWAKTEDVAERARGLRRFSELELRQGRLEQSESRLRQAYSLYLAAGRVEMAVEAQCQLAEVIRKRGDTGSAIDEARGAVAKAEGSVENHLAMALYELGLTLANEPENLTEAEHTLRRASEEACRRSQLLIGAQAAGDLANLLASKGRLDEALPWNERSEAMYQELGHQRGLMICARNVASWYQELGRVDDQISALRRALEVARREDESDMVAELSSLLAEALGTPESLIESLVVNFDHAQRQLLREAKSGEEFDHESHSFIDKIMDSLPQFFAPGEALDLISRLVRSTTVDQLGLSIALASAALDKWKDHPGPELASLQYEYASLMIRLGDYATAHDVLAAVYGSAKKLGHVRLQIASAASLSLACQSLGLIEESRRALEETIPLATDGAEADTLRLNLAVNHMRDWEFSDAEPILNSVLESSLERGDRRMAAVAAANLAALKADTGRQKEAVDLLGLIDDGRAELGAHQTLELLRLKGYVLELAERRDDAAETYEEMIRLTEATQRHLISPGLQGLFLGSRQYFYPRAVRLVADGNPAKALYLAEVGRARALAQSIRGPRGPHPVAEDIVDRVRARLLATEVVVAYYISEGQLLIWCLSSGEVRSAAVNVETDELFRVVEGYRGSLDGGSENDSLRARLTEWLVQPIRDWVRAYKTIYFSPHGSLHHVPFQILGDGERLVEAHNVATVPALHLLDQKPPWDESWKARPLVVGDPTRSLPAARDEALRIARTLPGSRLLLGGDATKAEVLKALSTSSLLHLASHAEFDPHDPFGTGVALAGEGGGIEMLTVPEIVRLAAVPRLIVLSACETRLASVSHSDDPIGLATAFLIAGAETIVSSLWQVSDEATAELMESFYSALATLPPIEALAKAQRRLASGRGGFDASSWGAFTAYTIASSRRVRGRPRALEVVDSVGRRE